MSCLPTRPGRISFPETPHVTHHAKVEHTLRQQAELAEAPRKAHSNAVETHVRRQLGESSAQGVQCCYFFSICLFLPLRQNLV